MTNSLVDAVNIATMPSIGEGDAGVILKKDGSFQLFNTHEALDAKNLTEMQIEQGKKLLGIAAALRLPALMQILMNAAGDPELFPVTVDPGKGH